MSLFDAYAPALWDATTATFGDRAVWRYADGTEQSLHVIMDSSGQAEADDAYYRRIYQARWQRSDVPDPIPGDQLEVQEGRWAGTYLFDFLVDDDGYRMTGSLGKMENDGA